MSPKPMRSALLPPQVLHLGSFSLILSIACAALGCDGLDNCPSALAPVTIESGRTDTEAQVFESAPWSGPLAAFPAQSEVKFIHGLGSTPELVQTYLSFAAHGTNDNGAGDVSENAGNQGAVTCVDARMIVVKNGTCEEEFYIRVVAFASGSGSTDEVCE